MARRMSHRTLEERLMAVKQALRGNYTQSELAHRLRVSRTTIKRWVVNYQNNGVTGLEESHTWRRYPADLKRSAVEDYLHNHLSLNGCCKKYNISNDSVLRRWINQYTNGKTLKTTTGGSTKMKARRKTTYKQRLEIVSFTLAKEKDYQAAIEKYGVSYSQVYGWVRKYEQNGPEGLVDHRGHKLQPAKLAKLSEEEQLQRRIKELEAQNQLLKAENFYLKKVRALKKHHRQ